MLFEKQTHSDCHLLCLFVSPPVQILFTSCASFFFSQSGMKEALHECLILPLMDSAPPVLFSFFNPHLFHFSSRPRPHRTVTSLHIVNTLT